MNTELVFRERLRSARQARGLTQQRTADGLGMTKVGYQNYEYGRTSPAFNMLPRLAHFFNVSSDYLLGLSDEPRLPDKETLALAHQLQAYRQSAEGLVREQEHQAVLP